MTVHRIMSLNTAKFSEIIAKMNLWYFPYIVMNFEALDTLPFL